MGRIERALILFIGLQVLSICTAQSSSGSVMFIPDCMGDSGCEDGEICVEKPNGSTYCKKECTQNCTGEPKNIVCGSNGENYDNLCELEKFACEEEEISLKFDGPCATPAPPKPEENTCTEQNENYGNLRSSPELYQQTCNEDIVAQKASNNTLKLSDLNFEEGCYKAHCSHTSYRPRQCIVVYDRLIKKHVEWCWCMAKNNTAYSLEKNKPKGICEGKCYDGKQLYDNNKVFKPNSECGICKCKNGVISCYSQYVSKEGTPLDESTLAKLKLDLMKKFNGEYNGNTLDLDSVRHFNIAPSKRCVILKRKFKQFETSGNNNLSSTEFYNFYKELDDFIGACSVKLFEQLEDILRNGDESITMNEWINFFDPTLLDEDAHLCTERRKRETSENQPRLRKRQLRKKFYYTLE